MSHNEAYPQEKLVCLAGTGLSLERKMSQPMDGERTWELEDTMSSGRGCAGHGAEGCLKAREPRHQLHPEGLEGLHSASHV